MRFSHLIAASALLASACASASAATMVRELDSAPDLTGYASINFTADSFKGLGRCGTGGSVVGDGCEFAYKTDAEADDAYGRPGTFTGAGWWDSQDLDTFSISLDFGDEEAGVLHFADAMDQKCNEAYGCPRLSVQVEGEEWNFSEGQRENANDLYLEFSGFVGPFTAIIHTRANDGLSIDGALLIGDTLPPAPVPLNASFGFLFAAVAGLVAWARIKPSVPRGSRMWGDDGDNDSRSDFALGFRREIPRQG